METDTLQETGLVVSMSKAIYLFIRASIAKRLL